MHYKVKEGRGSLFIVLPSLAEGVTAPCNFMYEFRAARWILQRDAARSILNFYCPCLQAVAFRPKHIWKQLSPCLNKSPTTLEMHFARHHRNGCLQLQNMAAPTSHCSCVCMFLGFISSTHFCKHWTILQHTIVSFCLNYPVENNRNILLRRRNAAGCSNAWIFTL